LRGILAAMSGTVACGGPEPGASEALPNFGGIPYPDVTPSHSQELVVRLHDIDGVRLSTASAGQLSSETGIILRVFRYEPPNGASRTIERLVLPWVDVRAGVYVRSAVPHRLRVVVDQHDGTLATSVVLGRRASVAVYRETPRWVDGRAWQVVVVVT
jgi:hypothetical protein